MESLLAHQGFLNGLARRLVDNEPDADDLVQDAWLASLQAPAPRSPGSRAWLGALARNRWRNRLRNELARKQRERRAAQPEAFDASEAEHGLELRRRVIEAVRALPEPYLTTIYMRYYEERSIADVAARTRVPPETARSRIQRAIELLRGKLDHEFGSRGSWAVAVGAWCHPERSAGPATPSVPLAGTLGSTLGWIAVASVAASALLVTWITLGAPVAEPEAPTPALGQGLAPQGAPPDRGAGSEIRAPLQESGPAVAAGGVAAATPGAAQTELAPVSARAPSHQDTVYDVRGRVVGPTGLPVAGAQVHNNFEHVITDEEGRFKLEFLVTRFQRAGQILLPSMRLIASMPGHHAAVVPDIVTLLPDDPFAPYSIELVLGDRPRTLSGKVVTATGAPALGWKICLRNPTQGTAGSLAVVGDRRTLESLAGGQPLTQDVEDDGSFLLDGLFERPYDIIAWHPESLLNVVAEAVPASVSHLVLTAPDPAAGPRVAGRVASRAGVPLAGARISGVLAVLAEVEAPGNPIRIFGKPVEADEQGYFEFDSSPLGVRRLLVEAEGVLLRPIELEPLLPGEDWEQLELIVPVRCQVVLEAQGLEPPSDLLSFLDRDGRRLSIQVPDDEVAGLGGQPFWRAVSLRPGPTRRVLHTRDDAVTALFFDHDGSEIETRAIQVSPQHPTILTW